MCRIWRPPRNSIFVRSKLLLQVISLWLIFTLRIDVYALRDLMGHCYVHFAFLFTLMKTKVPTSINPGHSISQWLLCHVLLCTWGDSPVQSNPVQSSPIQSNPVQSSPIQSNPIQSNPVESSPVKVKRKGTPLWVHTAWKHWTTLVCDYNQSYWSSR